MNSAFLGLMLCGCPWISAEEHADNRASLVPGTSTPPLVTSTTSTSVLTTETPTQPTTSTTASTTEPTTPSTTAPTSTTSPSGTTPTVTTPWVCEADEREPNDTVDQAYEFGDGELPVEFLATHCLEDSERYPDVYGYGLRYDWFSTRLEDLEQVVLVQVRDGLEDTCETMDMALLGYRPNGSLLHSSAPPGVCPILRYGHGEQASFFSNTFLAYTYDSAPDMDYTLSIETIACPDSDGDGALDISCGGFDCQPLNAEIHPEAREISGSGLDEDCDGVFEGLDCDEAEPSLTPFEGDVPCMAPRFWESAYDVFRFDVTEGNCVEIRTDRMFEYGPELLLEVEGANGQLRTSSRLSSVDYQDCSHPSWSGGTSNCPTARFVAEETGTVRVAVGQAATGVEASLFPMSGACPLVGDYQLGVTLDGFLSVPPVLVHDDRIRSLGESPF